jgi:hypothetical protein
VSVQVSLDVGKESHFADVLDNDGGRLFSRAVGNDQDDIEALLDRADRYGVPPAGHRPAGIDRAARPGRVDGARGGVPSAPVR